MVRFGNVGARVMGGGMNTLLKTWLTGDSHPGSELGASWERSWWHYYDTPHALLSFSCFLSSLEAGMRQLEKMMSNRPQKKSSPHGLLHACDDFVPYSLPRRRFLFYEKRQVSIHACFLTIQFILPSPFPPCPSSRSPAPRVPPDPRPPWTDTQAFFPPLSLSAFLNARLRIS